ncbi:CD226 antigen [Oreochromis niloticus]|uniref:CD226 antigen n=1 Tax=Oreochromis niloticus TaxID=8128 RepID=UPI00039462F8|nr:CD226 antigen [Oreochromis niloticus]
MFFVTASLCSTLMFVFVFVSADQRNITAESGQDVSLPCRAPNNNIIVLEWRRAEYGANYVFLYRDGRFDPANQDPSFKNRVDLQDRQMKDGDVSLILNNVNTADTGTYKCRVFMRETRLWQLIYLTVVDPPDQKIITAESGQDVTLTCRAPNNILVVDWRRADLGDENVLFHDDGKFVPDNQHPLFKNRVDLQDRQMKDGDVSLILRDVTTADAGTYQCRVFIEGARTWKLVSIINLNVPPGQTGGQEKDEDNKDGGKEDGSVWLIVGLSVSAVLLVVIAVLGFLIYRKKHQPSKEHPADQHSKQPLQT